MGAGPSGRGSNPALVGRSLIFVKPEDDDIRAPILGMGREMAISRCIRILVITATNLHELERTALLATVLKHVNWVGKSVDEGHGDHCSCPYFATARPVAFEHQSRFPPQCRRELPLAHTRTGSFRRTESSRSIRAGRAWPSPPARRQACPGRSHYGGIAPRLLICRSLTSDRSIGVWTQYNAIRPDRRMVPRRID